MSSSAITVVRQGIAGAGGSLVMFAVMEPTLRANELAQRGYGDPAPGLGGVAGTLLAGAVLGGCIAGSLTFAEELGTGRAARIAGRTALAGMAGFVIGMVSIVAGALLFRILLNENTVWLARSAGWSLLGGGLGLAGGAVSLSLSKIRQGILGGLIGGLIGGFVFDILPDLGSAATLSRLFGFTAMGLCIGLAVALVQEVARKAWVTVLTGRGEGTRYLLNKPRITIGRAELADVPLYGDASLDRTQVEITNTGQGYAVAEVGQRPLLRVDGQPGTSAWLQDGSLLELGSHRLRFSLRGSVPGGDRVAHFVPQPPAPQALWPPDGEAPPPVASPVFSLEGPPAGGMSPPAGAGGAAGSGEPALDERDLHRISLQAESGPHVGTHFPIPPFGARVGRAPDCEICLGGDAMVSRLHAEFFPDGSGWVIRDAGSRNGIVLNGERVQEAWVNPGDRVQLGAGAYRVLRQP